MAENYSANAVERLGLSAAMIGLVTVVTAVPLARIAQKRVVG